MALSRRDRFGLGLQRSLGQLFFPFLGGFAVLLMRFGMGYRILELRQLRRHFKTLIGKERTPLLICANHLTLIDSAVIQWTLASNWFYLFKFRLFAWNMPERRNFAHNPILRVVCYLLKCVPVIRGAPPQETKKILEKLHYLLRRNQALFIFPEGTRSPSGRVNTENFGYGVGRLLEQVEGARVLCVYQRGKHQRRSSNFPKRREKFYTDLALIQPTSDQKGLRAARDVATQIIEKLHEMEQKYFADLSPHRQ